VPAESTPLGRLEIVVDGELVEAFEGDTVAGALAARGIRVLRRTVAEAAPRGLFCCMGVCYDCVVSVDGNTFVRACMTDVVDGMRVDLGVRVGEQGEG